ncbi:hypothetical protein E6H29_02270 [Candidatus Bathyarchaeota archaeon]|nr:MAG: hypothetical protein E6H29_02270 [Candidatus Bathyarchaeota archaeon]
MTRKGNPVALMKGIRHNSRMSPSAKRKAMKTLRAQAQRRGLLPKIRNRRTPQYRSQGFEGFREAGVASVKLLSHPVDQAIEGYHVVSGVRKLWNAFSGWLDSL